jgi:SAM-dependent methyltransferase
MTIPKTPFLKEMEIKLAWKLKRGRNGLKEKLVKEGRSRWLDIGSGGTLDSGNFSYLDWVLPDTITNERANRFHTGDITTMTDVTLDRVGRFDLIRMQHVFEHFSAEDGQKALQNCARLLDPGGYLLMTVPDLESFIKFYKKRRYNPVFFEFARQRIPPDAPSSFYFSIFAHSFGYQSLENGSLKYRNEHRWCYDYEGLAYQVRRTGQFTNIRKLGLLHPLASMPFTHNRPAEDVCILAQKI